MAIEKLREDRYRGQKNDEVRLGWDYEQTHIFYIIKNAETR